MKEMIMIKLPIKFKALWERVGIIDIDVATCDVCNEETLCLVIDSSAEEYGPGRICKDCANSLFEQVESDDGDEEEYADDVEPAFL